MALREKSPLGLGLSMGAWLRGLFFWPFFMALFHKQNSAGENPLVRRMARGPEGRAHVKRGLMGSSPAVIVLNFTRGLPA
jgi:hypothetical protein